VKNSSNRLQGAADKAVTFWVNNPSVKIHTKQLAQWNQLVDRLNSEHGMLLHSLQNLLNAEPAGFAKTPDTKV